MPRVTQPIALTISLDNPFVPPPFGAAAHLTEITVATNAAGQPVMQPSHNQFGVTDDDITDELLAALNLKLMGLGLVLMRSADAQALAGVSPPAPAPAPAQE